jgi:hypothetical protein
MSFQPYNNPFTVPSNCKIIAKAYDKNGNTKEQEYIINNIDKTLPVITIDDPPETAKKNAIKVNINCFLNSQRKEIKKVKTNISTSNEIPNGIWKYFSEESFFIDIEKDGTFYVFVEVIDSLNKITKSKNGPYIKDSTIPNDPVISYTINENLKAVVTISYDGNIKNTYTLNDGEELIYTQPFILDKNKTIVAYDYSKLGIKVSSTLNITGVIDLSLNSKKYTKDDIQNYFNSDQCETDILYCQSFPVNDYINEYNPYITNTIITCSVLTNNDWCNPRYNLYDLCFYKTEKNDFECTWHNNFGYLDPTITKDKKIIDILKQSRQIIGHRINKNVFTFTIINIKDKEFPIGSPNIDKNIFSIDYIIFNNLNHTVTLKNIINTEFGTGNIIPPGTMPGYERTYSYLKKGSKLTMYYTGTDTNSNLFYYTGNVYIKEYNITETDLTLISQKTIHSSEHINRFQNYSIIESGRIREQIKTRSSTQENWNYKVTDYVLNNNNWETHVSDSLLLPKGHLLKDNMYISIKKDLGLYIYTINQNTNKEYLLFLKDIKIKDIIPNIENITERIAISSGDVFDPIIAPYSLSNKYFYIKNIMKINDFVFKIIFLITIIDKYGDEESFLGYSKLYINKEKILMTKIQLIKGTSWTYRPELITGKEKSFLLDIEGNQEKIYLLD